MHWPTDSTNDPCGRGTRSAMAAINREVAAIAAAQFGIASRAQLLARGITYPRIRRALDTGRVIAEHPDVFRVAGTPQTWRGRVMAAELALGPTAVAIGQTAAAVHGLRDVRPPATIEIASPKRTQRKLAGVTARVDSTLTPAHIQTIGPLAVATPALALIDIARLRPAAWLAGVMTNALIARHVSYRELAEALAFRGGRDGAKRARRAFRLVDPAADRGRSAEELLLFRRILSTDLPVPSLNATIDTPVGPMERDLVWFLRQYNLEIDGLQHLAPNQAARDEHNDSVLASIDWFVRRVPASAVRENMNAVMSQIRADLARLKAQPIANGCCQRC